MKNIILLVALSTAVLLTTAACGKKSEITPTAAPTASPSPATAIPTMAASMATAALSLNFYGSTVVKQEIDNLTRADVWAVVPAADALTEDEIKECMTSIIEDYTNKNKVTAVTLFLADTMEDVERSSYTLGRCMYYPGGNISNAVSTTPGDYASFTYQYEIHSLAGEEAPTDLEIEIYDYVNAALEENSDEEAVNNQAAEKYGITVDELNLIWAKVYTYKH